METRVTRILRRAIAIARATAIITLAGSAPTQAQESVTPGPLTLRADQAGPVINRDIFDQFAEHLGQGIYGGVWVGRDSKIANVRGIRSDVVVALRAIEVPVVRWPGGCFADRYHWRNGIGPADQRKVTWATKCGVAAVR